MSNGYEDPEGYVPEPAVYPRPTPEQQDETLFREFEAAINRNSRERRSGTPDHILASVAFAALVNFEMATNKRDDGYQFVPKVAGSLAKDYT